MERATHCRRTAALIVVAFSLAACGHTAAEKDTHDPTHVQAIAGSDLRRVTLSEAAAKRIDVQTQAVGAVSGGTQIPYAAVLYDPKGATWAFVSSGARSFQRAPIALQRIEGDVAFLTDGPPVGTQVVTVGATELYGAELGVGNDE
jgi:hypothetical protein